METYGRFRSRRTAVWWWPVPSSVDGRPGRHWRPDQVADQYKVFAAALRGRGNLCRRGAVDRLVYAPSAQLHTLATLELHGSPQLPQMPSGRRAGITASALLQVVGRRHYGVQRLRGIAAYQRGVRRGDVIAQIEGEDTKGLDADQAVGRRAGPVEPP